MSADSAAGVVERCCKVHGVKNLYVAGCSVFPGYEGYPTMTLVALALRLADHFAARNPVHRTLRHLLDEAPRPSTSDYGFA